MDNIYLKALTSLLLVLCLIGLVYLGLRYILQIKGFRSTGAKQLFIEEVIILDNKRKLVLCGFRNKKYVILLGSNDLVLDVISEKN